MQDPPEPIGTAPNDRRWADLEVTAHASGVDDPAIAVLGYVEAALSMALLVVITVSEQRPELQRERRAGHQAVGQHRPGRALLHPDSPFDDAAVDGPAECGQHPVDLDLFEAAKPVGVDSAIPVLLSGERLRLAVGAHQPLLDRRQ